MADGIQQQPRSIRQVSTRRSSSSRLSAQRPKPDKNKVRRLRTQPRQTLLTFRRASIFDDHVERVAEFGKTATTAARSLAPRTKGHFHSPDQLLTCQANSAFLVDSFMRREFLVPVTIAAAALVPGLLLPQDTINPVSELHVGSSTVADLDSTVRRLARPLLALAPRPRGRRSESPVTRRTRPMPLTRRMLPTPPRALDSGRRRFRLPIRRQW